MYVRVRGGLKALGISLSLTMLLPAAALAAKTATEFVRAVEKAKILSPELKIQGAVRGEEVIISTYRNPKASDKDCKIDAVLVAKEVMALDPESVRRVKVVFYDTTNTSRYRQVVVREGDVKAFATRQLSPAKLLSSIEITTEGASAHAAVTGRSYKDLTQTPEVVDGPYRGERLQQLGRIQALKQRGVAVPLLYAEFLRLEDRARHGDQAAVVNGLNFLNRKLNEQEGEYNRTQARSQPYSHTPATTSSGGQAGLEQGLKRELGEDAPAIGPQLQRRYRIARRIRELQAEGRIVDQYRWMYREIEQLAAGNDTARLALQLKFAEHKLGLPSFSE